MLTPDTVIIDRYRIVRHLGEGGMGAVYEAVDTKLSCPVAIKETFAETDEMRRYFKREAALLANLRHAALPKVTDHFELKRGQFLVMEYIPGKDLMEMLKEHGGPFPPADVSGWATVLLDALDYLHRRLDEPVYHRDIKPANLKLTNDGEIILLDFGLAKGRAGEMSTLNDEKSVPAYTPGFAPLEQVLRADQRWSETLQGISPEKTAAILREPTDARGDIFSLGATLYSLLTHSIPVFVAMRAVSLWSGKPDPLLTAGQINPQIPDWLSAALSRAMSVDPAGRFATALEMREALREPSSGSFAEPLYIFTHTDDGATAPSPEPRHQPEPASEATTLAPVKYGLLGTCQGAVRSAAFAPNGRLIASGSNDGIVRLWDVGTGRARALRDDDTSSNRDRHVSAVAFTHDALNVVSAGSDNTIRVWDVSSGSGRVVRPFDSQIRSLCYSPVGPLIAAGGEDGSVHLLDSRSGQVKTLGRCRGEVWSVAFSPDGQSVAAESDDHTIYVWDVGTLRARAFESPDGDLRALAFSPDGVYLAAGGWDRRIRLWDTRTHEVFILGESGDVVRSVAFSPDGTRLASGGDDGLIRIWHVPSGPAFVLGSCDDVVSCVDFSSDGVSVVSGSWDHTVRLWDVTAQFDLATA